MGTVTVSEVELASVTAVFVAPKYTMFSEGVELKLLPVIITVVPIGPEIGAKEVMDGCPETDMLPNSISSRKQATTEIERTSLALVKNVLIACSIVAAINGEKVFIERV